MSVGPQPINLKEISYGKTDQIVAKLQRNQILLKIAQGAEGIIYRGLYKEKSVIIKVRPKKNYRIAQLDKTLRRTRTRGEIKALTKTLEIGRKNDGQKGMVVPCPELIEADKQSTCIIMEDIRTENNRESITLKKLINHISLTIFGQSFTKKCEKAKELINADVVIPAKDDSDDEGDELVDLSNSESDLLAKILKPIVEKVANMIANLHLNKIIHGDITSSNILARIDQERLPSENTNLYNEIQDEVIDSNFTKFEKIHNFLSKIELVLIDFGLAQTEVKRAEERAVDLYVLERAWISTHPTTANCLARLWKIYFGKINDITVEKKLKDVRQRGRKRSMLG